MNKIIVIAVHPDDETLGCGGTILKHKAYRDEVYWFIITDMKEEDGFSKKEIIEREKEIEIIKNMYDFDKIYRLNLPAKRVDEITISDIIRRISIIFQEVKPNIIYLPFKGDIHSDHRKIFECAFSCVKNFRYPFIKKILMMETISETEFAPPLSEFAFIPNYFVNITEYINKKLDIINIYKSELGVHPFPRNLKNIEALALFRGAMAGCQYAESFMILKDIW